MFNRSSNLMKEKAMMEEQISRCDSQNSNFTIISMLNFNEESLKSCNKSQGSERSNLEVEFDISTLRHRSISDCSLFTNIPTPISSPCTSSPSSSSPPSSSFASISTQYYRTCNLEELNLPDDEKYSNYVYVLDEDEKNVERKKSPELWTENDLESLSLSSDSTVSKNLIYDTDFMNYQLTPANCDAFYYLMSLRRSQ